MKQHKAMIVALIVICITAVVAALVTRKDLCGSTSELARRRLLFSRLTNPVKSNGGGDPRHFTGARISSTHPGFTLACPRAGFWEVSESGRQNFFTPSKKLFERGLLCSPVGPQSFLAVLAAAVSASRSNLPVFRQQRGIANHPVRHRGQT